MTLFISLEDHEGLSGGPIEDPGVEMKPMGGGHTDPDVVDQATLAVAEAKGDVESERETVQEIAEAIDALESYKALLNETLENGGVDFYTQKAIQIGVESMVSKFDIQTGLESIVSMENIHTPSGKMTATYASLESLEIALEGLWDKFKTAIKNVVGKVRNFFTRMGDAIRETQNQAEHLKKEILKNSEKMTGSGTVSFKGANLLMKDGEVNTPRVIESIMKYKRDMLDSGKYQEYWNKIAKLLQTDEDVDPRDLEYDVRYTTMKLPSYFEVGDKFGISSASRMVNYTPYTWSVTDNFGLTIALNQRNDTGLSCANIESVDVGHLELVEYSAPSLSKEQALKVCDSIIIYAKSFKNLTAPAFITLDQLAAIQDGTLDRAIEMEKGGINTGGPSINISFESRLEKTKQFLKGSYQEGKKLLITMAKIGFFIKILGTFTSLVGKGVSLNRLSKGDLSGSDDALKNTGKVLDLLSLPFSITGTAKKPFHTVVKLIIGPLLMSLGKKLDAKGFSAEDIDPLIKILSTGMHGLSTFLFTLFIGAIITTYKHMKDSGNKDPVIEEAYEKYEEIYEKEINALPEKDKEIFINPQDFAKAETLVEDKEYRGVMNAILVNATVDLSYEIQHFTEVFQQFSWDFMRKIFDMSLRHVRASLNPINNQDEDIGYLNP